MIQLGLKIGSRDTKYAQEIQQYYSSGIFQYIELFALCDSYNDTIEYWQQFKIPYVIHAAHSMAGLNLADAYARESNEMKIKEAFSFADALSANNIIFHSGTNGQIKEVVAQLKPYTNQKLLIENKPVKALGDKLECVGYSVEQLSYIIDELQCGFVLDFGHAICAANTLGVDSLTYVDKLCELQPQMFHLTDGAFSSEHDMHLHYGEGDFPIKDLLSRIPNGSRVTNEAKRNQNNLSEVRKDAEYLKELYKDDKN